MRSRFLIPTFAALLLLSSCGGSEADKILKRMHERFMVQVQKNARLMSQPLVGRTDTKFALNVSEIPDLLPVSADIRVESTVRHDVRSSENPLVDLALHLGVLVEAPTGTFGTPLPKGGKEQIDVDIKLNARAIEHVLLLNIAMINAKASSLLPEPFSLPEALKPKWYGAGFDDINRMLAESSTEEGEKAVTIEQLISSAFQGASVTPADTERLLDEVHIWTAVELLPEKNGRMFVRVESDKEKIRDSVRAFLKFLEKTSGPSWQNQFQGNPEFQKAISDLEKDDSEFMKTMGTVKGVIGADKATYEFKSFEGDITNASGALVTRVAFDRGEESDFNVSITDLESEAEPTTLILTKKGDDVRLLIDAKEVMKGTATKEKVDVGFMNPETGKTAGTVQFEIAEWSATKLSLKKGRFESEWETKKLLMTMSDFTVDLGNDFKDMSVRFIGAGTLDGKPLITVDLDVKRAEIDPFTVEKPLYAPFETLNADLMGALMGGAGTGVESSEVEN